MTISSTSWAAFEAAEPDFAGAVRARFAKYKHHVLATLREDGSPRVTGLEADFHSGELWLGMMAGSRKALDLHRDPRFALHANPGPDTSMDGGDVRVSGRAVEITDPDPGPNHLFRTELTEVVRVRVESDQLVIETWRPGRPVRTVRRK